MVCPTGKKGHLSREAALEHQKALVWRNHLAGESARSKGLNVYPCQYCAAWHVGHHGTIPLVYHYTIYHRLDQILREGFLKPRPKKARSAAINEPNPLLWFSWNSEWDHSVLKDPRPINRRFSPPTGRAVTEMAGGLLIRFGAPAYVAKLRWNDYLALNKTPRVQRDGMALRGNPTEWLATNQRVPLSVCHTFEVWYQGAWVPGDTIADEDLDTYMDTRKIAYAKAWYRLTEKILTAPKGTDPDDFPFEDDAERILYEDLCVEVKEDRWAEEHQTELLQLGRYLQVIAKGKGVRI